MSPPSFAILENRGVLAVAGEDARTFLQGLVSNDVNKLAANRALYAAFLTPQGKYLHDFFMAELGGAVLLDCERERLADLQRRLSIYKLRAKATLADRTPEFAVAVLFGDGWATAVGVDGASGDAAPVLGGVAYVDPRLADVGGRAILPRNTAVEQLTGSGLRGADPAEYDSLRLRCGLPDGSRDLIIDKSILLESGFDELNGVDWDKGCYMGQELTARTKYRGLVKKRLVPVAIEGPAPAPGTPIQSDGKEAGEMRSARGDIGLALLRLEYLGAEAQAPLVAGEARLTPRKPAWIRF